MDEVNQNLSFLEKIHLYLALCRPGIARIGRDLSRYSVVVHSQEVIQTNGANTRQIPLLSIMHHLFQVFLKNN